jgi:uncharacterized coiled-coil protein SlyX
MMNELDYELAITRLRERLVAADLTVAELQSRASGDGRADSWLQRKVVAQAKALTRLNERVTNQRFTLRGIESLGRGLTSDELARARELEGHSVAEVLV